MYSPAHELDSSLYPFVSRYGRRFRPVPFSFQDKPKRAAVGVSLAARQLLKSLNRNLTLHQKESEKAQDAKANTLRAELGAELQANRKELQLGLLQTTQALEAKVGAIDVRLDNRLKELSTGVQTKLETNLKEGFLHFEKVQHSLKQAELQLQNLNLVGQSINDLNNLLKMPHLRGNFGEAVLERLLSDMLPTDAYELQYRIVPGSTERVDAVIKYPNHVLPIDSKFPREQVLPLFETNDPIKLDQARRDLVEVMEGARENRSRKNTSIPSTAPRIWPSSLCPVKPFILKF